MKRRGVLEPFEERSVAAARSRPHAATAVEGVFAAIDQAHHELRESEARGQLRDRLGSERKSRQHQFRGHRQLVGRERQHDGHQHVVFVVPLAVAAGEPVRSLRQRHDLCHLAAGRTEPRCERERVAARKPSCDKMAMQSRQVFARPRKAVIVASEPNAPAPTDRHERAAVDRVERVRKRRHFGAVEHQIEFQLRAVRTEQRAVHFVHRRRVVVPRSPRRNGVNPLS